MGHNGRYYYKNIKFLFLLSRSEFVRLSPVGFGVDIVRIVFNDCGHSSLGRSALRSISLSFWIDSNEIPWSAKAMLTSW
jgi:hypothetical protein